MSDQCSVNELRDLLQRQAEKIEILERRVKAAEKQVEAAEIYSRQDCLILRGKLDVRPNCSLRDEVARLIHHHTGIHFQPWCLNTVHWLGKGDSIIIRFNNKAVRDAIYRNRVPKDPSKRGLFIHESLTTAKVQTVAKCTKLRREGKLATYYTQSGQVFVKRTKESPCLQIPDGLTELEIINLIETQPTSYRDAATRTARLNPPPVVPDDVQQRPDKVSEPVTTEAVTGIDKRLAEKDAQTEGGAPETEQTVKTTAEQGAECPNRQPEELGEPLRSVHQVSCGEAMMTTNGKGSKESEGPNQKHRNETITVPTENKDEAGGKDKSKETGGTKLSSKSEEGGKLQTDCSSEQSSETSTSPRRKSKRQRKKNKRY